MSSKYLIGVLVISFAVSAANARQSRTEARLITLKEALMSADYRGDLTELASLRDRAAEVSNDSRFGYLADYWRGFASWRIVVNGASGKMTADEAKGHLARAAEAFESSIRKKSDFADSYAGDAGVHGWLAAYKTSDPAAMNQEVDIFKRQLNKALELEPNNPRVLWIEAVPFAVLPPERGGNLDRAIELYRQMARTAPPLDPGSPLPDWGKVEALMSLANAHIKQVPPNLDAATAEVQQILELQPDWHYVRDVLTPQIEAKRKPLHDFDYLLGDWEFTGTNQQYGKIHGYWSAARLDDGVIFDEYRVTGDKGETYYLTRTVRAYNWKVNAWELVSTEEGAGLQNLGTGHRDGAEVHIEQTFGAGTARPSLLRIRYFDIQPDHFSWAADRSNDSGKSWVTGYQQLDVKRIGPARAFALTSVKEVQH